MRKIIRTLSLLTIFIILISCTNTDKNVSGNSKKTTLTEKQIGKSNYFISIPANYSLTASNGPDFSVYYFSPTDTTLSDRISGGLYFGNFPHEFEADNDSCKTETLKGNILGNTYDWTVYNCNEDYSIQTIADNKSETGSNQRIHAFGHGKSKEDLKTILKIFTTLNRKKGS